MKKIWISVALIGLILLSSCAKSEQMSVEMPAEMPAADYYGREFDEAIQEEASPQVKDMEYANASGVQAQAAERLIIKNASLGIAVKDPTVSLDAISKLANDMGGFVVSSSIYKRTLSSGVQVPQGNITIRVPAERLDEALGEIKAMAADPKTGVINENVSGQDVTSDYVDSQSRLRNLEAAESQLVELLGTATSLEYTLDIFRELTSVRSEIEVLKGHIKYLEESAALSAISVDVVAEETLQPIEIAGWKPKGIARDALQALINTLQWFGTAAIWLGIYCLPFLIPLSIAAYFLVKAIRKRRTNKKLKKQVIEEEPKA